MCYLSWAEPDIPKEDVFKENRRFVLGDNDGATFANPDGFESNRPLCSLWEEGRVTIFLFIYHCYFQPGPMEGVEEVVLNPDSHETSTLTYNRPTAARLSFWYFMNKKSSPPLRLTKMTTQIGMPPDQTRKREGSKEVFHNSSRAISATTTKKQFVLIIMCNLRLSLQDHVWGEHPPESETLKWIWLLQEKKEEKWDRFFFPHFLLICF